VGSGPDDAIRLRAPEPGDAEAVLAVIVARDRADLGVADFTLDDLRDWWGASDFDLATDAVVAQTSGGALVGYASVRRPGVLALVAPDHEGRGIGTRLLAWAEKRERELGRAVHTQWVGGPNPRADRLLRDAGYVVARTYWRMVRSLADGPAEPVVPGFDLRAVRPEQDGAALHAVDDASFAANPDYRPEPLAGFIEEHLQAHDLDPGLSIVAERRGEIAGFLLVRRWAEEAVGFVDILAVHPDHQRHGLGTALLHTAFARCAAAGLREAQLGVASDNPRARRLYERAGMTPRFRVDTYERPAR
jgi:mycothiol synthase